MEQEGINVVGVWFLSPRPSEASSTELKVIQSAALVPRGLYDLYDLYNLKKKTYTVHTYIGKNGCATSLFQEGLKSYRVRQPIQNKQPGSSKASKDAPNPAAAAKLGKYRRYRGGNQGQSKHAKSPTGGDQSNISMARSEIEPNHGSAVFAVPKNTQVVPAWATTLRKTTWASRLFQIQIMICTW